MPRSCRIVNPAQDVAVFRAGLAPQGIKAVLPAPTRYPAEVKGQRDLNLLNPYCTLCPRVR